LTGRKDFVPALRDRRQTVLNGCTDKVFRFFERYGPRVVGAKKTMVSVLPEVVKKASWR
jgi:hypothetical protein